MADLSVTASQVLLVSGEPIQGTAGATITAGQSCYYDMALQNPANPGWYFHTIAGVNTWDVNGTEMLVWGNYCNVIGGATPINIYYSTDSGKTVKIAYTFGQNPYNRDDDGSGGGGKTGTPLGRPQQPGDLPTHSRRGVQPGRERILRLHRRL